MRERCWGRTSDPYSVDACRGRFGITGNGVLDGTNAKMKWCGMYVVSGDGRLDGMWMQSDARGCLVRGVRICVAICGMHDVMDSGGQVWNGDGGCFEMYGSVGCGRVRAVP